MGAFRRRAPWGIGLAAAAWLGSAAAGPATGPGASAPRASVSPTRSATPLPTTIDHAYRVVGRAKLLLFSYSDDDVGGARLTWHREGETESVRLLVGSEPTRAPRDLNEWAYTAEAVTGNRADVFAVRSSGPSDGDDRSAVGLPRDARGQFRASCMSAAGPDVQTFTTTVATDGQITYHAVGRLLDRLNRRPEWKPTDLVRPLGAAPGFLTAISRLLRESVQATSAGTVQPVSVPYVYNGAIYDLNLRRIQHQRDVLVSGITYPELLKGDFVAVRRRDKDATPFTVSYAADGPRAGVPVVISFRASWWLRLELQLDDRYDVPTDPASDASVSSKIRDICAQACTRGSR